jgi:hypothetical protein
MNKEIINVKLVETNSLDADTLNNIVDIMKKPYFEDTPYEDLCSSNVELSRDLVSDIEEVHKAISYLIDTHYLVNNTGSYVSLTGTTFDGRDEIQALTDIVEEDKEVYFDALDKLCYIDYSKDEAYVDVEFVYDIKLYRLYL